MNFTPFMTKLEDGRKVPAITVPIGQDVSGIAKILGLNVHGALAIVGGAGNFDQPEYTNIRKRVSVLFNLIADMAVSKNLAIVDGGTPFGVMRLLGEVCATHQNKFPLVGVAPSGQVLAQRDSGLDYEGTWFGSADVIQRILKSNNIRNSHGDAGLTPLDKNHSIFVLVEADEWGQEVDMLAAVTHELNHRHTGVEILINGGTVAPLDAQAFVKRGGHVIVIEGTGRFADKLAKGVRAGVSSDPIEQFLIDSKRIHLFGLNDPPMLLLQRLIQLSGW